VAYLPHARKVELQNQPFLSNTRTNNGTAGLRNSFLGYGSVNTLPRRRMTSHSNYTGWESRDLPTVRYSWRNNRTEFSVRGRCEVYITRPCNIRDSSVPNEFSSRWRGVNAVAVLVQLRVNNSRGRSTRTRERIGTRSTEENKRSACEELTCDWKAWFMCNVWRLRVW
jgi:hypothetical protein